MKMKRGNFIGFLGGQIDQEGEEAPDCVKQNVDLLDGVRLKEVNPRGAVEISSEEELSKLRSVLVEAKWWHLYDPRIGNGSVKDIDSEEFGLEISEALRQVNSESKRVYLIYAQVIEVGDEGEEKKLNCYFKEIDISSL